MKKNLVLTIIVVALNGWALINLFHYFGNEHTTDIGTGIGSGKKIALGSSQNIVFAQDNQSEKREISWTKTEVPVGNSKRTFSKRNADNGSQFNSLSLNAAKITDVTSSRVLHLSAAGKPESADEGSSAASQVLNILESNKQINQVRLTAIGSQYAYNLSKTSLSESTPTNGSGGGVMQKADDNPGGYNDVPAGNYWLIFCVSIFFYLLVITFREAHFSTIIQKRQND